MPQGTDLNKVDGSRNCIICHYWHFLDINVKFQFEVCNTYHNLMNCSKLNFNDLWPAIGTVKENDNRIHIMHVSKDKAIVF